jgi:hypothetical protein
LALQIGSLYQVAPAKGLSTLPLVEVPVVELLDEELELEEELVLLEELELLLVELLLLEDVLPVLPVELLELEELLDDELEEPPLELPPIEPAEAVRVTRSRRAPSSRRLIRSV